MLKQGCFEPVQRGLTLIELLITLSIFAILTMLGSFGWSTTIAKSHADSAAHSVREFMAFARISAINHNVFVTLCPSQNQVVCSENWHDQWIVFTDKNKNKTIDEQDQLLRVHQVDEAIFELQVKPSNRNYFRWNPTGATHGTPGSIVFCHHSLAEAHRKITISMMGRTTLSRDGNSDGLHEDTSGALLVCEV